MKKTDIKRKVNIPASIIILIVLGILLTVLLFFSIKSRHNMEKKSKSYKYTKGTITDYQEHEHEDDDGDDYYTYSYTITYRANFNTYTVTTGDIFNHAPYNNESISIMYNPDNPSKYYTAKKDWLTGLYFSTDYHGDMLLFTFFLFLSIFLIVAAMLVAEGNLVNILLGCGFLLLGLSGLFFAFVMKSLALVFMMVFGVLGIIILYRVIFIPKDKRIQDADYTEYARLFIIRDIFSDASGTVVLFSQINDSGKTLYAYNDNYHRFNMGDKFQLDTRLITDKSAVKQVRDKTGIDISYIPVDEFKPLGRMSNFIFSKLY